MVNLNGTMHGGCAVSLIDVYVLSFLVVVIWASRFFYPRPYRASAHSLALPMLTERGFQVLLDGFDRSWHAHRQALQLRVSSAEHHLPCTCAAVSSLLPSQIVRMVPDPCFSPFSASDSGVKIEIVNTTVSFGARTVSAVTEVSPRLTLALAYLSVQRLS